MANGLAGPGFVRRLGRSPAYSLLVIATLGLSLFILATMTSVVDAVLLQPLPYASPDQLVALWESRPSTGASRFRFSVANALDVAAQRAVVERAALFQADTVRLLSGGEPQQLYGARVEPDYFRILGTHPQLGRTFADADSSPGAPRVVVLSHALFAQRFGSDPGLLGRPITLDDQPVTVVGILPPGLYPSRPLTHGGISFLPEVQQYWIPLGLDASWRTNRRTHVFGVLARLRPGETVQRAAADLRPLAQRLAADYPATNRDVEFEVSPLADELVGSSRRLLWVMLGAAFLIVALATANLAGVAVSRAVARRFETAVRVSLGAARSRLLRETCGEALSLAAVGTALGLILSGTLRPLLLSSLALEIPRLTESRVDGLVVAVTFAAAVLSAIVVGCAQVYGIAASRPETVLRQGGFGSGGGSGHRRDLHRVLVIVQVSLSVVLVCLAGLFARSWVALQRVDPGFAPDGVLSAEIELPAASYGRWERVVGFQQALVARLTERPGVVGAAVAYDAPLASSWSDTFTLIDGGRAEDSEGTVSGQLDIVSPGYFRTAGIPLRRGRPLNDLDDRAHPGAVVVSESFARVHFPEGDALGKRLRALTPSRMWTTPAAATLFTIVGVVGDVHSHGLEAAAAPAVYFNNGQFPQPTMTVLVRLGGRPPLGFATELRGLVRQLDPTLPLQHVTTLPQLISREMAQPRFALGLAGLLGLGALLLATLGIYGLLTLIIRSQAREFAVRFAIGARPAQVARQVLGETCRLTAVGTLLGLLGALGGAHALRSLLFGVATDDPLVVVTTAGVLFLTGVLAALGPLRRAARTDPALALRSS